MAEPKIVRVNEDVFLKSVERLGYDALALAEDFGKQTARREVSRRSKEIFFLGMIAGSAVSTLVGLVTAIILG